MNRAPPSPVHRPAASPFALALVWAGTLALSGCLATVSPATPPAPPPAPAPPVAASAPGIVDLLARPAERSLVEGVRAYDAGQYTLAEPALTQALAAGLVNPRDQATAHKLLAFIACASQRVAACEHAFRAARAADPGFVLSRSERGHPMWGPVYRRVLAP
ncbi:MAG: TssQ family T6SS-associated lipoprotein [Rubrivivax sp.]